MSKGILKRGAREGGGEEDLGAVRMKASYNAREDWSTSSRTQTSLLQL